MHRDPQRQRRQAQVRQHQLYCWICGYEVLTQKAHAQASSCLLAGRAYLRVQFAATAHGLSMHPLSQALQEYPEQAAHYQAAHQLMAQAQLVDVNYPDRSASIILAGGSGGMN